MNAWTNERQWHVTKAYPRRTSPRLQNFAAYVEPWEMWVRERERKGWEEHQSTAYHRVAFFSLKRKKINGVRREGVVVDVWTQSRMNKRRYYTQYYISSKLKIMDNNQLILSFSFRPLSMRSLKKTFICDPFFDFPSFLLLYFKRQNISFFKCCCCSYRFWNKTTVDIEIITFFNNNKSIHND